MLEVHAEELAKEKANIKVVEKPVYVIP